MHGDAMRGEHPESIRRACAESIRCDAQAQAASCAEVTQEVTREERGAKGVLLAMQQHAP